MNFKVKNISKLEAAKKSAIRKTQGEKRALMKCRPKAGQCQGLPSPKKGFPGQSGRSTLPGSPPGFEVFQPPLPPWARCYLYSTCGRGKGVRNYDCANSSQRLFRAPGTCQANPLLLPLSTPCHTWFPGLLLLAWNCSPGQFEVACSFHNPLPHPTPGIHSWFLQGEARRPFTRRERPMEVKASGTKWSHAPDSGRETEPAQAHRHCHSYFWLLSHKPVHWTIWGLTDVGGQCSTHASLSCLEPIEMAISCAFCWVLDNTSVFM